MQAIRAQSPRSLAVLLAARRVPRVAKRELNAGGDVAVRQQQAKDRLRAECDVGIDPEQVGEVLGQELDQITILLRPRVIRLSLCRCRIKESPDARCPASG